MSAPATPPGDGEPQTYVDAHPNISATLRVTHVDTDADLPGFESQDGFAFEIVGPRGGVKAAVWLADDVVSALRAQIDSRSA